MQIFGTEIRLDRIVVNLNDKKYINLTLLTGTKYSLDFGNLALDITIPAEQNKKQYFNTIPSPITNDIYGKSTKGAFVNYDLVLSRNENTTYASALNNFNLLGSNFPKLCFVIYWMYGRK